jgi:hypothetical protein
MMEAVARQLGVAELIPDPDTVRKAIERNEQDAELLRRLLRLALRREQTPEMHARLRAALAEGTAHAH